MISIKPVISALMIGSTLSGCMSLPSAGPTSSTLAQSPGPTKDQMNVTVIPITPGNVGFVGLPPMRDISAMPGNTRGARQQNISSGDVLAIRIWEANPDGLFSAPETPAAPLTVTVDAAGKVFLPYAGQIHADSLSIDDFRENILRALDGKVIDPQVQIVIKSSERNSVSITGGVSRPGVFPIGQSSPKLLDAIALAGGSRTPAFKTEVSIIRGDDVEKLRLSEILRTPDNNVRLQPGDIIDLSPVSSSFLAFGSVARKSQIEFTDERLTLAEAIAQVGGLDGRTSDARGVFLFRTETPDRMAALGIPSAANGQPVNAVYQLDMTTPEAFFLAKEFEIADSDILYVAPATSVEMNKFLSHIVSPLMGATLKYQSITE